MWDHTVDGYGGLYGRSRTLLVTLRFDVNDLLCCTQGL